MGDRTLQRQHRREPVDMRGELFDHRGRLEAEMIVAMRRLCRAAGIDAIDLRRHLVARAEPGFAGQRDDGVAVIFGEIRGIGEAMFFQRIPDAVVGAGLGEVVAAAGRGAVLFLDDLIEDRAGAVDDAGVS
jgi:hypothetical protein